MNCPLLVSLQPLTVKASLNKFMIDKINEKTFPIISSEIVPINFSTPQLFQAMSFKYVIFFISYM